MLPNTTARLRDVTPRMLPHENASTHQRHAPHANTHKNRVVRAADGLARPKAPNRPLEESTPNMIESIAT